MQLKENYMDQDLNATTDVKLVPNGKRIFSGLFFVWTDILFLMIPAKIFSNLTPSKAVNITLTTVFTAVFAGIQLYANYRGYSLSKIILGRQVVSKKNHKPANMLIQFIRPHMSLMWAMMLGQMFVLFTFTVGLVLSLFQRKERNFSDHIANQQLKAQAAVAGVGLFGLFFYKFPKLTWMYDTILGTTVIEKSYKEIFNDLKFDKKIIAEKIYQFKKAG